MPKIALIEAHAASVSIKTSQIPLDCQDCGMEEAWGRNLLPGPNPDLPEIAVISLGRDDYC